MTVVYGSGTYLGIYLSLNYRFHWRSFQIYWISIHLRMWLSGTTVIISCISSSDGYNLCSQQFSALLSYTFTRTLFLTPLSYSLTCPSSHTLPHTLSFALSLTLSVSRWPSLWFTLTSTYALFASYCCLPSLLLFYFSHDSPDNTLVCCGTSPLRSDPNSKSLLCFYEVKKSISSSLNINELPVLQIAVEGGGISAVMVKWHGVTNQILCR